MWWGWAVVAGVIVLYASFSDRLGRLSVTAPMVFVALGAVVSENGLDIVTIEADKPIVTTLFKVTLAMLLFIEAASLNPRVVVKEAGLTGRLLGPAMLLVILGGALAALVLFDVANVWEAAVIGAVLAPTDAALGLAVVSNKRVPGRVRRALIVESGLNDGLALPLALAFTAAALVDLGEQGVEEAVIFILEQIGYGLLAGVALGFAAGWVVRYGTQRGWAGTAWQRLAPLAATLLAYAGAESIDGNGFISVWAGGLLYGYVLHESAPHVEAFGERVGSGLAAISFFVFGAILLAPALSNLTWQLVLYGLLSLALIRPLGVGISMLGTRTDWQTTAFLGWFGPRGIASIIIAAIVIEDAGLDENSLVVTVTSITVGLSVYLHGLSSQPGARRFADWHESREADLS